MSDSWSGRDGLYARGNWRIVRVRRGLWVANLRRDLGIEPARVQVGTFWACKRIVNRRAFRGRA